MNNDLETIWEDISFEGLRNTEIILNQDSSCPCRDSNPAPPEYKSRALLRG
jgi:hypothetical protein